MAEDEKKEKPQLPKSEVRTPDKVSVKNGGSPRGEGSINISGIKKTSL